VNRHKHGTPKAPETSTHTSTGDSARARLIARDGARPRVLRRGLPKHVLTDFFHNILRASWLKIFVLVFVYLMATNSFFSSLYLLGGNAIDNAKPGSFLDAFFFSVQTMATIGYGFMRPIGVFANIVATFEAFFGLITFALVSGLLFAKLARPTAKVLFSSVAVISRRDGRPCLMFRLANARGNQILGGSVQVTLLRSERTLEGEMIRSFRDLELMRSNTPVFALSWSVVHFMDDPASPLFGSTLESLRDQESEIVITFVGVDETFSQEVHARHSYIADELRWNSRFVDVLSRDPSGMTLVDYGRFHSTQPL
jgi:inward rectifier potassium channel